MTREEFEALLTANLEAIKAIRDDAWELHKSVNQHYDTNLPYGIHLDMVANGVIKYGNEVIAGENDLLPMIFGAYFHDSIEDARQTYNDVRKTALKYMDEKQALTAAEIVYAVTNDKGRTRAQRAGEKYYAGIRQTPYAPLIKICDRMANTAYSVEGKDRMATIYAQEYPHFIQAITADTADIRLSLPPSAKAALAELSR